MRGTDWLRRKAAVAVRIEETRPAADEPQPVVMQIELPMPTALDMARIAEQIQTAFKLRPADGDALRCPCGVIYSRCYYGH